MSSFNQDNRIRCHLRAIQLNPDTLSKLSLQPFRVWDTMAELQTSNLVSTSDFCQHSRVADLQTCSLEGHSHTIIGLHCECTSTQPASCFLYYLPKAPSIEVMVMVALTNLLHCSQMIEFIEPKMQYTRPSTYTTAHDVMIRVTRDAIRFFDNALRKGGGDRGCR